MHGDADLERIVSEVLAPLIWADQGEVFVVTLSKELISLHLGGRFAGCPGNGLVLAELLEPALRAVAAEARIEISSGAIIPKGAVRLEPPIGRSRNGAPPTSSP